MRKTFYYGLFLPAFLLVNTCISQTIRINEVMSWNTATSCGQGYSDYPDWIEIANTSQEILSLSGWTLSDRLAQPGKWTFPDSIQIDPEGYIVVFADGFDFGLHTNFELKSEGEWLGIFDQNGNLADSISIPPLSRNISFGRVEQGIWKYFEESSPGLMNAKTGLYTALPEPVFSHQEGYHPNSFVLNIESPVSGASIQYTSGGYDRENEWTTYGGPILIGNSQIIMARLVKDGYLSSPISHKSFFISETPSSLPTISLSTHPDNLWDSQTGIYVTGTNGIKGNGPETDPPRNWNQDWEKPTFLEYYDTTGQRVLAQEIGIKIFGGWSRRNNQKSLSLFARKEYGDNRFSYPFFPQRPFTEYKSVILRNAGNDWSASGGTMIRDPLHHALAAGEMEVDHQAFQPVKVYLNGEYWGIHNMREKLNEHYLRAHHQIDPESVNILEGAGHPLTGNDDSYREMIEFIEFHNLGHSSNYELAKSMIDIEEFIDYYILQMYIANKDWPGNNIKFWQSQVPGSVWRWLLYDTDFGFGIWDFTINEDMVAFCMEDRGPGWPNPPWSTLMFRKLINNPEFKKRFLQRTITHLNTTFRPERVAFVVDSIADIVRPGMQQHLRRWGSSNPASWEQRIWSLKNFGLSRARAFRGHLQSNFSIWGEDTLWIQHSDPAAGRILMMDKILPDSFQGVFLNKVPVPLEARPVPGFRFAYWLIQGDSLTQRMYGRHIDYPLDSGRQITAVFEQHRPMFRSLQFQADNGQDNRYISIFNPTEQSWNLGDYKVEGAVSYQFAHGTQIQAGAEIWLAADPFAISNPGGAVFQWNSDSLSPGNDLWLRGPDGILVDSVRFDTASPWPIGEHSFISLKHPELSNELGQNWQEGKAEWQSRFQGLVINEVASDYTMGIWDEREEYEDWVELYNGSDQALDLAGLCLSDDNNEPCKWQFPIDQPSVTTLGAGQFLIIWADGEEDEGLFHTNFSINKSGENLWLHEAGGLLIDQLNVPSLETNETFGRETDGSDLMVVFPPHSNSPKSANHLNTAPVFTSSPKLEINPEEGFYLDLTAIDTEGDPLYYEALALPSWLNFQTHGPGDGEVWGHPSRDHIGEHLLVLKVSDTKPGSYSIQKAIIRVVDPALDRLKEDGFTSGILFPNPVRDLTEYFTKSTQGSVIQLSFTDLSGRQLQQWEFVSEGDIFRQTIDLSIFPKGIYLMEVKQDDELTEVIKVLVQ